MTWLFISIISLLGDGQGLQRAEGFSAASAAASERQVPMIVFVHGSDWNGLGQRLHSEMWVNSNTDRMLSDIDLVITDIDVLQSPTEAQDASFGAMHEGWKKQGLVTYPALIAFDSNGVVLGSRQGETLPRTPSQAQMSLLELAQAAAHRQRLEARIKQARNTGDVYTEVTTIYQIFELPLDRPKEFLERLAVLDPNDSLGRRRRLDFPPWHQLIGQATKDAKEGRSQEALDRLNNMLSEDVYSDSQEAWLHIALGAIHRKTEGHDAQAASAFKNAWQLDPDGIAGNAGKRWYLQFYSQPSLLFGWQPRHCTTEATTWIIEDLPSHMSAGLWKVTFEWTKGHHGLSIDSVTLVDRATGSVIASDKHSAFAGTRNKDNSYSLQLPSDVHDAQLQVVCRSDGGTNSTGVLSFILDHDVQIDNER